MLDIVLATLNIKFSVVRLAIPDRAEALAVALAYTLVVSGL